MGIITNDKQHTINIQNELKKNFRLSKRYFYRCKDFTKFDYKSLQNIKMFYMFIFSLFLIIANPKNSSSFPNELVKS